MKKRADRTLESMPVRHAAYEILSRQSRPIGAYGLLAEMTACLGRRVSPITVYRALNFLVQQRLARRLESINAYVAFSPGGSSDAEADVFLICNRCGTTAPVHDQTVVTRLQSDAARYAFLADSRVVEVKGICRECQKTQSIDRVSSQSGTKRRGRNRRPQDRSDV